MSLDLSTRLRCQSATSRAGLFEQSVLSLRQLPEQSLLAIAAMKSVPASIRCRDELIVRLATAGVVVA